MPPLFTPLTSAAETAYANLVTGARQADLTRCVADLPGGFSSKTVSGKTYWYYQRKGPDGKVVQIYIGPDNAATLELMAAHKQPDRNAGNDHLRRLSRAAMELGCPAMVTAHARILQRLTDHGFFHAGGVLIGTHAFLAYQNMFGVTWAHGTLTMDLDFAHPGKNISIAVSDSFTMDAHEKTPGRSQVFSSPTGGLARSDRSGGATAAIDTLRQGFIPNNARTTFVKADEPDLQLDFVTTQGRSGGKPVLIKPLNIMMQPLRFMEFSMGGIMKGVLLTQQGPMVVNLPRPERYALHKLLIHGERSGDTRLKARKDLDQAACLLAMLKDREPDALADAYRDLCERGPDWRTRFSAGLSALEARHPGFANFFDEAH